MDPADELVLGAYTGAVRNLSDAGALTLAVTWVTPGLEFGAVVTEATPARLRVRLFGFQEDVWRVGLRPWRLLPGRYELSVGEALASAKGSSGPERFAWRETRDVSHTHRGAPIWISLAPRRTTIVDLRLREAIPRPFELPDLAIAARDIRREGRSVRVAVHNIGSAPAGKFRVALLGEDGSEIGAAVSGGLAPVRNLSPSVQEVEIRIAEEKAAALRAGAALRVRVDPDSAVDEICEENNEAPLQ